MIRASGTDCLVWESVLNIASPNNWEYIVLPYPEMKE